MSYLVLFIGIHLIGVTELCAQKVFPNEKDESRWTLAVRLAGVYEVQPDDDLSVLQSGFGYDLEVIVPISRRFAITAAFNRVGLKTDDLPQYWSDDLEAYASTLEYTSYRYMVGVRYSTSSFFGVDGLRSYYGLAMGGRSQRFDGKVSLRDVDSREPYEWYLEAPATDFTSELKLGFLIMVKDNIGVDIGYSRYLTFDHSTQIDGDDVWSMWQTHGFWVGLTYGFVAK